MRRDVYFQSHKLRSRCQENPAPAVVERLTARRDAALRKLGIQLATPIADLARTGVPGKPPDITRPGRELRCRPASGPIPRSAHCKNVQSLEQGNQVSRKPGRPVIVPRVRHDRIQAAARPCANACLSTQTVYARGLGLVGMAQHFALGARLLPRRIIKRSLLIPLPSACDILL